MITDEDEKKTLVAWDDKFAIGIPLIDNEHKMLVSLCNKLYRVMMHKRGTTEEDKKELMRIALRDCAEYSNFHFRHEEELMELCHFDEEKFNEHKAEHKSFVKKIFDEIKVFEEKTPVAAHEFVLYLYDWILTHIAYSDKLYVQPLLAYLKEHPEIVHHTTAE